MSKDNSDTLKLLYFFQENVGTPIKHKNIRGYVDPNPLMVERQDPDNLTRFQTRERCALEIAAYVFKISIEVFMIFFLIGTLVYFNLLYSDGFFPYR